MEKILSFDTARVISMFYIIGILHLSGYTGKSIAENEICVSVIWSTLGVFTFISAYLLGSRYNFSSISEIMVFYKKRLLRFYPLFLISSLALVAIGFNSWDVTWKGLLGISPFWKPQQQTLWYIATLMFMYLITPALGNGKLGRKVIIILGILVLAFSIECIFHTVDSRFYYYFLIYAIGVVAAKHFPNSSLRILSSKYVFFVIIIIYVAVLSIMLKEKEMRLLMLLNGYIGTLLILNLSSLLVKYNYFSGGGKIVPFISYGSMCAYLFHRELYWCFLQIYTPRSSVLIWLYLFFVAFPVILITSYYIQKIYNNIFK